MTLSLAGPLLLVGAGKMGGALLEGWLRQGLDPATVFIQDPAPPPDALQDHEVWLEESASAAARLALVDRHQAGGIATWRLGLEDPRVWGLFQQWRSRPS